MRLHWTVLLVALIAAVAWVLLGVADWPMARLAVKPVPVLILAIGAYRSGRGRYGGLVALGLTIGAIGDVVIGWPGDHFLAGLVCFLVAQMVYTAAFLFRTTKLSLMSAIAPFAWSAGFFWLISPGLGDLTVPVAAYAAIIGGMGWRAIAAARHGETLGGWLSALGAGAFILSDSLLGVDRFRVAWPGAENVVMASYWAAQAALAWSVVEFSTAPAAAPPAGPR